MQPTEESATTADEPRPHGPGRPHDPPAPHLRGWTIALALLLCAGWGGLAPAIKIALRETPPVALAGWRFLIGLLSIAVWCRLRGIRFLPGRGEVAVKVLLPALFVLQIALLNAGARFTSGGHAILLLSTHPLFVAILAHFALRGDRLGLARVAGLLLAVAGVAAVVSERLSGGSLHGDAMVLASAITLGVLIIITKRAMARGMTAYQTLGAQMLPGVVGFFLVSLWLEGPLVLPRSPAVWLSIVYQGVVVAGFCFVAWNLLLERYSASRLTAFQFTTPIFGVVFSALFLGEALTWGVAVGTALVGLGLWLSRGR